MRFYQISSVCVKWWPWPWRIPRQWLYDIGDGDDYGNGDDEDDDNGDDDGTCIQGDEWEVSCKPIKFNVPTPCYDPTLKEFIEYT